MVCVTGISLQSGPFCFWFLPLSVFLVFPLLHRLLVLTAPLDPSTAVYRAPAEGDILTVSCDTANKRTFLNDEPLLCKWPLTDAARQSPVGGCDSDHLDDCGEVSGGYAGRGGPFTARWLKVFDSGQFVSDTLVLKVKKFVGVCFMGMSCRINGLCIRNIMFEHWPSSMCGLYITWKLHEKSFMQTQDSDVLFMQGRSAL